MISIKNNRWFFIMSIFAWLLIGCKKEELANVKRAPSFNYINQNGKTISNADYQGKVYIVEFFFASCPSICKTMNANMVKIQNNLIGYDDFGIVSYTVDPNRDSPANLLAYAKKIGATNPNWNFLTGYTEEEIYRLATEEYFSLANKDSIAPGGFVHTDNFILVDKHGNIRSRKDAYGNALFAYHGTEFKDIQNLIVDVKKLLNE